MAGSRYGRRVSLTKACELLGVTRAALYRLVRQRRITYVQEGPVATPGRRGSSYYFYERDLEAYITSTRREAIVVDAPLPTPEVTRAGADISDLMPAQRRLS